MPATCMPAAGATCRRALGAGHVAAGLLRPAHHLPRSRRGRQLPACEAYSAPFRDEPSASTFEPPAPATAPPAVNLRATAKKTRVVVLGSGWGAVSFIKNLDAKAFGEAGPYELVVVSPRNYMLYTPLLPSAMGGVVSENSIVESIRTLMHGKGMYYEARAVDIDPEARTLTCFKEFCEVCAMRKHHGHTEADHTFTLDYDILLCSVGAVNATFGIPGVQDNCWFLKSMEDANRLRKHISKTVEHAALPSTSLEDRKKMLRFVVVGGGPTGVEVAAELHDLVTEEFGREMKHIKDDFSITLINGPDSLLNSFHEDVQAYAGQVFEHHGIHLQLGTRVTAVHDGHISVEKKDGSADTVPFGTCIWATGIAMHPLVASLKAKLPADVQNSRRGLLVDSHLRVLGTQGTVFCIGDAAVTGATPQSALPPTAQVARQEGEFLAALLSRNKLVVSEESEAAGGDVVPLPPKASPFSYLHMGSLAYLGGHKGVMDLPVKLPFLKVLKGYLGAQTWRGLETFMQISSRTRWLVTHDWMRMLVFGRNIADI